MRTGFALGSEEAIGSCGTHGEQSLPALLRKKERPMPLQCFKECGQKRDQSSGADFVARCPGQMQVLLDLWSVVRGTWALEGLLHLRRMIEEMNGILASRAGTSDEGIEDADRLGEMPRDTWALAVRPTHSSLDNSKVTS
jgi:hypothetical protein